MIEVLNQQNEFQVNKGHFKNLLERLVKYYRLENPEIVLAFVDHQKIKELNKEFLNKNKVTDVLSFPHEEKSTDGRYYLGDIVISVAQASRQSSPKPHDLKRELEILTIHGFLHLLGFEHFKGMEEEEEKIRNIIFEGRNEKG